MAEAARFHRCCNAIGKRIVHILPFLLLVLLTFFGAFLFHLLEEPNELKQRRAQSDVDDEDLRWSFWSSFVYTITIYTTLGFGSRIPESDGGRAFLILIAIVGIPTLLAVLHLSGRCYASLLLSCWHRHYYQNVHSCPCCFPFASKVKQPAATVTAASPKWKKVQFNLKPTLLLSTSTQSQHNLPSNSSAFPVWTVFAALLLYMFIAPAFILFKEASTKSSEIDAFSTASAQSALGHRIENYKDALWYFLRAALTLHIGGDKLPSNHSWGLLVDLLLVLIAYVLVATTIHLIHAKLQALLVEMRLEIEERCRRGLELGKPMASTNDYEVEQALNVLIQRQSFTNQIWLLLLTQSNYSSLMDFWKAKAKLRNAECQTDETNASLPERKIVMREQHTKDRKSRDDINSLVAMIDYTLNYPQIINRP